MNWTAKVLLDALIATISGCLMGGVLFALFLRHHTIEAAQPVESLLVLVANGIGYALFTLPLTLVVALCLTLPAACGVAWLERKTARPPRLRLQLLVLIGLAALMITPPAVSLLVQQREIAASGVPDHAEANAAILATKGSLLLAIFFGSHVLLHGGAATVAFNLLRKRRLSQSRDSASPSAAVAAHGQDG